MICNIRTSMRSAAVSRNAFVATALLVCFGTATASAHESNNTSVLEWNQIALAATVTAAQGPLPQGRSMTIVQVAVHDAVNAITCDYRTYLHLRCMPWNGSADAAAIAAAHRVLVSLFPAQAAALNTARATSLSAHGLNEGDQGVALGEAVAAAILAIRANDGAAQAQFPYTSPGAGTPGVWAPLGVAPALLPGWGAVMPWVLQSGSQFRPGPPPPLTSARYARDHNEVRELGSATSVMRSAEQTEIARFWLATPSAIWNGIARQLIEAKQLDLSSTARALALVYLATSDAGVACWDAKYTYNFWRPTTAIRQGDLDGNSQTIADAGWTPLFNVPQHPEYMSGHSTNSAAMATALILLFGDDSGVELTATSPTNPTFQRHWTSISQGVDEVISARIYGGFHFRTSNERGARVGQRVARYVFNHELQPRKAHRK
jgi:hypothetical protein